MLRVSTEVYGSRILSSLYHLLLLLVMNPLSLVYRKFKHHKDGRQQQTLLRTYVYMRVVCYYVHSYCNHDTQLHIGLLQMDFECFISRIQLQCYY